MARIFILFVVSFSICGCILQPKKFEANIPDRSTPPLASTSEGISNPIQISLTLNHKVFLFEKELGTTQDTSDLHKELERLFDQRKVDGEPDPTAVILKSPKELKYGEVKKLVEELKTIGAAPIGLQIVGLDK